MVQVRLAKAELSGIAAVQRQLLVEGGVGQVDQTTKGVGVRRSGGGQREQPHVVEQEQVVLDQPGAKPHELQVAGGDPPDGGMGQLALQVRPPEREQVLAQPGHAWPLQHISQKASSNRAARVKSTPSRWARAGDGVPASWSRSRPRALTKVRNASPLQFWIQAWSGESPGLRSATAV